MSIDMTPSDQLNDQLAYLLLNKVKHTGDEPHDVSFFAEDFPNQTVDRQTLIEQLHQIMPKFLTGELDQTKGNSENPAAIITCKNALVTTEGLALLKAKYYKVDEH